MAKQILVLLVISVLLPIQYACADASAGMQAYNAHDYVTALAHLKPEAENGNRTAQNIVGVIYMNALGVPRDDSEAMHWYRLSADQGYAVAQTNVGFLYENGRGVERNLSEAREWYEKASAQGDPRAAVFLTNLATKVDQLPPSSPSRNLPALSPPDTKTPTEEENNKVVDLTPNVAITARSPEQSPKRQSTRYVFGLLFGLIGYSFYARFRKQSKKQQSLKNKVGLAHNAPTASHRKYATVTRLSYAGVAVMGLGVVLSLGNSTKLLPTSTYPRLGLVVGALGAIFLLTANVVFWFAKREAEASKQSVSSRPAEPISHEDLVQDSLKRAIENRRQENPLVATKVNVNAPKEKESNSPDLGSMTPRLSPNDGPPKIPLTIGFANLSGDDLSLLVSEDAATLSPLFARSRVVPPHQIPSAEILFVYANLNEDGTIKGSPQSGIRQIVELTNAPIVVLASPNSSASVQKTANLPGPKTANLILTVDRNGEKFSRFFRELFELMRNGESMPMAYVQLCPQGPASVSANVPATLFLVEAGQIKFPPPSISQQAEPS